MAMMLALTTFAQKDVIKFLGIPVDGSKSSFMEKLKEKGFSSNKYKADVLTGEFNGQNVNIYVATNNNKVYRVMVADANTTSEGNIKIRFNQLVSQFENNPKYSQFWAASQAIPDNESISDSINLKDKRYQAIFYQQPALKDSAEVAEAMHKALLEQYTEEQLSNPTKEISKAKQDAITFWYLQRYYMGPVWFMIKKMSYDQYEILMYYDNEYNRAHGEDL